MGTTQDASQRGAVGGTRVHELVQTSSDSSGWKSGLGLQADERTSPGELFVMLFTVPGVENGNRPRLCVCARALCL